MRVTLSSSDRGFSVQTGQTVLDAALHAGLNLPHSCKGGNCGSCRARLLEGEIAYPNGRPLGLSDAEAAEGLILLCQAQARGDLSIETFEVGRADEARIKRLPSRVERAERLSHDVMALFLRLPAAEPFGFEAGQYIDIMLPGGRRRSFSIASPPHDSRLLELHVRRVAGGEFTEPLFAEGPRGALLTIEGPLGHFIYREPARPAAAVSLGGPAQLAAAVSAGGSARLAAPISPGEPAWPAASASPDGPAQPVAPASNEAPMLLVGGGTGLAPLKSILRHVLETGLRRDMTLYWGVRGARDLYAHAVLEEMARRHARFRYVPVLSEPSPAWQGRSGLVHDAVLADLDRLERHDIYASGPPAMIEAVRREFERRGASRVWFDSFDYAPDSLARQRTTAPTRS